MELIIYALIIFIILGCSLKLSLWPWRGRMAFGALVAAFVECAGEAAMSQSKTQIADFLQNTAALQNMAVIVTIESAVCFAFVICWLQGVYERAYERQTDTKATETGGNRLRKRAIQTRPAVILRRLSTTLLHCYPSLLMFPVAFYLLTQAMFTAVGTDFAVTIHAMAATMFIGLPLMAGGMKWLLPSDESRVEMLLIVACFVCVLGLASTENSSIIYKVKETPLDVKTLAAVLALFAVLFVAGMVGEKIVGRMKFKYLK